MRSLPKYATEWEKMLGAGSPGESEALELRPFEECGSACGVSRSQRREKFENLTLTIPTITIILFSRDPNGKVPFPFSFRFLALPSPTLLLLCKVIWMLKP